MANNNDVILTQEGKTKLEEELHYLETEKREEIGERIRVAREFGDISENSEYDDAKNEQAFLESRIAEISSILANAQIVDSPKKSNKANIGSTVTLLNLDTQKERVFTIVGGAEADAANGKISNESPLGRAVLGRKKDEEFSYEGPTGRQMHFKLVKVGV
ncbi:MAG: transcription elongation factor GreA [Coriobacteriales bacterium]